MTTLSRYDSNVTLSTCRRLIHRSARDALLQRRGPSKRSASVRSSPRSTSKSPRGGPRASPRTGARWSRTRRSRSRSQGKSRRRARCQQYAKGCCQRGAECPHDHGDGSIPQIYPTGLSTDPCRQYAAGDCSRGDRCRFSHGDGSKTQKLVKCRDFFASEGRCRFGERCMFAHDAGHTPRRSKLLGPRDPHTKSSLHVLRFPVFRVSSSLAFVLGYETYCGHISPRKT